MRRAKRGGKNFCCGKYYFGRHVHWHIPKEQKASFFEPSKCTIVFKLLCSVSVSTPCMFTKQNGSQIHWIILCALFSKILKIAEQLQK